MQQAGRVRPTDRGLVMRRAALLAAGLGLSLGLLSSCGSFRAPDLGAGDAAGAGGAGGAGGEDSSGGTDGLGGAAEDGGGMGGQGGAEDQPTKTLDRCDPAIDDCSEQVILHVSPFGFDGAPGTALEPLQTVGEALERAASMVNFGQSAPVIYACATAGAYVETLRISDEHGSVGVFGAFDCAFFERIDQFATIVATEPSGHHIEHAKQVTLGDLRLQSPNGSALAESSRALTVVESMGVRLLRSELVAGTGAAGAPGEGYAADDPADAGADGNAGNAACAAGADETNAGGSPAITSCGGSVTPSIGGRGGPGGGGEQTSEDGYPGEAGKPEGGTPGAGEEGSACVAGGGGDPGASGIQGVPSESFGTLDEDGYAPPVGGSGGPGGLGAGGGGGGGAAKPGSCATGASGGSGGGGGCPGAGAGGGQGGGGSFGLVSIASQLELSEVDIAVAGGGAGGVGGSGQRGGQRGLGAEGGMLGNATGGTSACGGGHGGDGGAGGSGAGGGGGPAIGVAYRGTEPVGLDEVEIALPLAAPGGGGGGDNADGEGAPGVVEARLSF